MSFKDTVERTKRDYPTTKCKTREDYEQWLVDAVWDMWLEHFCDSPAYQEMQDSVQELIEKWYI